MQWLVSSILLHTCGSVSTDPLLSSAFVVSMDVTDFCFSFVKTGCDVLYLLYLIFTFSILIWIFLCVYSNIKQIHFLKVLANLVKIDFS